MTITKLLNENVNLVGRIIRGEVIYECIQNITPNKEIVVFYDLKNFDTALFQAFYPSLFAASPFFRSHHHAFICRQALQGKCGKIILINFIIVVDDGSPEFSTQQIVPSIFPCHYWHHLPNRHRPFRVPHHSRLIIMRIGYHSRPTIIHLISRKSVKRKVHRVHQNPTCTMSKRN